ncbi:hypothetical protein [Methylomarinum vadi]|uniref:hypothetical protein n=1 Tax=Methylomarinum vadi TaxID=438855 RepID=UPI0004DF29DD|nr:hypothetical protein [Methylomarinum vadi]
MADKEAPDFGFKDRITIDEFIEASARQHEYYQKRREEKQKSAEAEVQKLSDSLDFLFQFRCTCGVKHLLLHRQDIRNHFLDQTI